MRQYQLRYVFTVSCGIALVDKLDYFYAINPARLNRDGFRHLLRSFKLIIFTVLHYAILNSLILGVCAINMTKFVGQNHKFIYTETGEGSANAQLWGTFGWSFLSLFQVSTMDWGDICRAIIEEAPVLAPFAVNPKSETPTLITSHAALNPAP